MPTVAPAPTPAGGARKFSDLVTWASGYPLELAHQGSAADRATLRKLGAAVLFSSSLATLSWGLAGAN